MRGIALCAVLLFSTVSVAAADSVQESDVGLLTAHRSASLLDGLELDATYKPSQSSALRLSDDLRFALSDTPAPLDTGGGLSSDLRQVLALILGFVPGFGIGHLIARDRDGFILFLIIDIALYVVWGTIGWIVWHPFGYVGGLLWLVVHIFQALDAYAEAGGERIVQTIRERAIEIARGGEAPALDAPRVSTRLFSFSF